MWQLAGAAEIAESSAHRAEHLPPIDTRFMMNIRGRPEKLTKPLL